MGYERRRVRPSFETPRKGAAPQDDGGGRSRRMEGEPHTFP